jgi:hypothetical protein
MTRSLKTILFLAAAIVAAPAQAADRWPKHDRFICRGVLVRGSAFGSTDSFQLQPDKGMLAWCAADLYGDLGSLENNFTPAQPSVLDRVLKVCRRGDHCEIRGVVQGHGNFAWTAVFSVKRLR